MWSWKSTTRIYPERQWMHQLCLEEGKREDREDSEAIIDGNNPADTGEVNEQKLHVKLVLIKKGKYRLHPQFKKFGLTDKAYESMHSDLNTEFQSIAGCPYQN